MPCWLQGGNAVGLGWSNGVIKKEWKRDGVRTQKTNPDGLMVDTLMNEVTK